MISRDPVPTWVEIIYIDTAESAVFGDFFFVTPIPVTYDEQ